MKYFTREELEDITKELVENPTRETLQKLNDKYNGKTESVVMPNTLSIESAPIVEPQNGVTFEQEAALEPVMPPVEVSIPMAEQPIVNPMPNFNIPNTENSMLNSISIPEAPNFMMPQSTASIEVASNTEMVNFNGNLFDNGPQMSNLMQTTDNFNSVPNTMPTTEVPITNAPFFGPHINAENNPIPVSGPINNVPSNEPTMFGQIAQNYM